MATRGCRSSRSRHGPVARARRSPQKRARNSSILGSSHAARERLVTRISQVPYILALDQGTSSSRAIVFDARGRKLGAAQKELTQHFPQPGWVEHDADEIWETTRASARNALKEAGLRARDLAAIGITNQRETIVLWDRRTGRPLHRAIVWQDRRTASATDRLRAAGHEAAVRRKTGLLLDPYFSGSKLRWLLDHVPGARKRAAEGRLAAGTVDSWLVWNLTRGRRHVTDVSNASRTMLMNLRTGRWDAELRRLLAIPSQILPEIVSSGGRIADTDAGVLGAERAHRRHPRRPAGRPLRPALHASRSRQVHLRHRLLPPRIHGGPPHREPPSPSLDRGLAHRRGTDGLRARGQRVLRRRRHPVAAGRPRDHPVGPGRQRAGRVRSGTRAASSSSRPSRASARRNGTRPHGARSSA